MTSKIFWSAMVTLSVASSACAQEGSSLPPVEQPSTDVVIYETTSWGRVTYRIELYRDGRLRAWQQDFRTGARQNQRDEQRSPELYTQALAAIAPLSPASELSCDGAPTDGPSGRFNWHDSNGPRAYAVYFPCYSVTPLPATNRIVRDATEAFFALTAPVARATAP